MAGITAAVALALTPDWFQFTAHASEAPLAVALMLWAVERHLDRRRGQAIALLAVVCLLVLVPFVWMISSSLKHDNQVFTVPTQWVPREFVWSNYVDIWKLKLEPNSSDFVRMTRWGEYPGYKASNPDFEGRVLPGADCLGDQRLRGEQLRVLLALMVIADLAEGLIVNHGAAPGPYTVGPTSR